jgi:predicted aspartyl protease
MPPPSKPRRRTAFSAAASGLLICYAMVKSKRASHLLPMVVDTGADCTTLPISIALDLGLDPAVAEEHATIIAANGLAYAPLVTVPRLSALGIELNQFKVACHDLPVQSRVRGLLGLDFLRHFPPFQSFEEEIRKIAPQFWKS